MLGTKVLFFNVLGSVGVEAALSVTLFEKIMFLLFKNTVKN